MADKAAAYQPTSFAYQGVGLFAYQNQIVVHEAPVPKYTLMVMPNGWIKYVLNKDYTP